MSFVPKGIIPPVVTPFNQDGSVNHTSLFEITNHLIENGVHGVFPLGTTGEFYGISNEDYQDILVTVKKAVNKRVPIYAGVNHITTKGAIKLAEYAQEIGVDAISVLTPMFISQTQSELENYYKDIAKSTDLPIIMYNNLPKTNVTIAPKTAAKLAEVKNIIGVKDSTGDFTNGIEYIRLTKDIDDFYVLMGRDTLIYPALCCGAVGAIASCANVAPKVVVDIYEKFVKGDHAGALEAQFRLNPLRIATAMGTFPAVIKEGLNLLGFNAGDCLPPISPLSNEDREQLRSILHQMELL